MPKTLAKSPYLLVAVTVLVASAIATPLKAQPFGGGLARADADGDGAISAAEAKQARLKMFQRLDQNGDNQISGDEVEALRGRVNAMARMLDSAIVLRSQTMDANGDGTLTQTEFMSANPIFEMIDRNGDGTADATELAEARARMMQRRNR